MAKQIEIRLDGIQDEMKDRYMIFTLGKEEYGIGIESVLEIIGLQPATPLPQLPKYINGVINLRGKIVPVMDVRKRLKKEFREYDERTCIIIIQVNSVSMGLIIDDVTEVVEIKEENILPPPQISKGCNNKFIKAIGKTQDSVKFILDCLELLRDEQYEDVIQV